MLYLPTLALLGHEASARVMGLQRLYCLFGRGGACSSRFKVNVNICPLTRYRGSSPVGRAFFASVITCLHLTREVAFCLGKMTEGEIHEHFLIAILAKYKKQLPMKTCYSAYSLSFSLGLKTRRFP